MLALTAIPDNTAAKLEAMGCTVIGFVIASNRPFVACVLDNRATPFVTWEVLPSGELHQGDYVPDRLTAFHSLFNRVSWPAGKGQLSCPAKVKVDDQRRLHCEDGPAFVWLEDVQDFYWHGTNVPAEWIADRKSLTATVALTWENVEQRRAACEIIGWANVLKELKAKTIDEDADPQIGKLVEANIPDIGKERFIVVECATKRTFALPMPPHIKTALEGQAWSYGVDTQVIRAMDFRT